MHDSSRRDLLVTLGALTPALALPLATPAMAATGAAARLAAALPIDDPQFNVLTLGRLQGDLSGKTVYAYAQGMVFGLLPGDGPALADYGKLLYAIEGCSVKQSRLRADGAVEERTRSWMLYRDAVSGEYLDEFKNPYTGETVPVPTFRGGISGGVMSVKGPEVSANFTMESTVFGRPPPLVWRFLADQVWIYRHAFTRWRESSTGLHKTEMTLDCWNCRIKDVANKKLTRIPSSYSWTSQTEWQSWLKMRGKPGAMLWRNEGLKLSSIDELPPEFVARTEQKMPGKLAEPLSWT